MSGTNPMKGIEMRAIFTSLVGLLLSACSAAHAQSDLETRILPPEADSPEADIAELSWMIGNWSGEGVGGQTAMENWTAPVGGTMVGTFIQQDNAGAILFTELMYVRSVNGSLEMALKHFNGDLTSWEEKMEVERFRLVALEPCAAFFQRLTVRCADKEKPGEGLVVAVRAGKDKEGQVQELVFKYGSQQRSNPDSYDCDGTTYAINQCLAAVRDRARAREKRYFKAAVVEGTGLPARVTPLEQSMRASQRLAEEYRKEACAAVYERWKEGSIRNAMALRCEIRLIDKRTRTIWRDWLTFQDSETPVLPEPKPSR